MLDLIAKQIVSQPHKELAVALVLERDSKGKPTNWKLMCDVNTMRVLTYYTQHEAARKAELFKDSTNDELERSGVYFG